MPLKFNFELAQALKVGLFLKGKVSFIAGAFQSIKMILISVYA